MKILQSLIFTFGYRKISVLFAVIIIQVGELFLLQRMYSLFTGGFLQPYSYLRWTDRIAFMGLSIWMDLVLLGAVGAAWFRVTNRYRIQPWLAGFSYIFFTSSVIGIWLAAKYKVLSYFNDTLNFLIIQNLGGGSLVEALIYATNEASIFCLAVIALVLLFIIGLRVTSKLEKISTAPPGFILKGNARICFLASITAVTIGLAALINSNSVLRYGLIKKTSYALISNALDELSDFDGDGTGLFTFPPYPALLDSAIYPGALDYPGNGIDEDGYGGDFQWPGQAQDQLEALSPIAGKHILMIMLESGRGDILGYMLNGQIIAPHITTLAENGSSIKYAYSHTGYTTTSITALFNRTLSTQQDRTRLTDFLEQSGYTISSISGQDESFGNMASSTGMSDPGRYLFDARSALDDRVFPSKSSGSLRLSEERIVRQFSERTAELDWSTPQFFYINLQAAHFPYSHPGMPNLINRQPIPRSDINEANRPWLEATYWNALAVADQAVGAMIKRLKELNVYEQTTIMILADHGESLFDDHFLGHGHALNQTQTRIPLVFNRPGIRVNSAVGQTDMAELLIKVATGRFDEARWNATEHPVFQLVGSLHKPLLIGTVSYGEIRTIIDFRTRNVFFSDLKRWEDYDAALKHPTLGARTRKLINLWETARWEDYLSRNQHNN